jgi:hypothetical protein
MHYDLGCFDLVIWQTIEKKDGGIAVKAVTIARPRTISRNIPR